MSIISQSYFSSGELTLPIDNISVQGYIDTHEPIILKKLLGYTLYAEFIAALDDTPAQKWIDLRDGETYTDPDGYTQDYEGIQQIIADYVYFAITSDKESTATATGMMKSEKENSTSIAPINKQAWALNDLAERAFYLNGYIVKANEDTEDTYADYVRETQGKTNFLNI